MIINRLRNMFSRTKAMVVPSNPTKMIVIVRTDIEMSQGKIAAQVAHAAVTLYNTAVQKSSSMPVHSWMRRGQPKVVLRSPTLNQLKAAYAAAKDTELNACMVYDAGRTEVQGGTLTVVGIGPDDADRIDKIGSKFRLL